MVPAKVFSSMRSVMAAPGMQCATRCGSVRNPHTAAAGALTTNVLTISMAMASGSRRRWREIALWIGDELLPATRIAEVEGAPGVLGAVARRCHGDGHAADRINLGARRGNGLGRKGLRLRVPQLDDLARMLRATSSGRRAPMSSPAGF